MKIHIGCGGHLLKNWVNIDRTKKSDVQWDVIRHPCPFEDNSASFIFSEHVWEHFSRENGFKATKICHKMLKSGGVLRVAVPGLKAALELYNSGNWTERDWIKQLDFPVKTGAVYLNGVFREWGHQFIYDEETLTALMKAAGFHKVYLVEHRKSNFPELSGLERRGPEFSNLIVEGVK